MIAKLDMPNICEWFHHNGFKGNPGKFNFLLSPFVDRAMEIMGSITKVSKEEVLLGLLGVRIDFDLTFKEHVTSICSRANELTKALHSHEVVYHFTVFFVLQLSGCTIVEVLIIKSTISMNGPFV